MAQVSDRITNRELQELQVLRAKLSGRPAIVVPKGTLPTR